MDNFLYAGVTNTLPLTVIVPTATALDVPPSSPIQSWPSHPLEEEIDHQYRHDDNTGTFQSIRQAMVSFFSCRMRKAGDGIQVCYKMWIESERWFTRVDNMSVDKRFYFRPTSDHHGLIHTAINPHKADTLQWQSNIFGVTRISHRNVCRQKHPRPSKDKSPKQTKLSNRCIRNVYTS